MTKHLLGFFCDSNKFHSVYSDSSKFKDSRLGIHKAVVKSLNFIKSESEWLRVPQNYSNHPVLDYIISHQLIFHTSDDDRNFQDRIQGYQCGMLMHLPVQDEAMSRTGVFVIRKDDGDWEPLTVRFKDQLYLLECKGVGSGLEGYTQFHHRNQAGSAKHHVRVTGGMTIDGVENEMKHLIQFQTYFNFNVSGILPFACIGFELESSIQEPIKLGLLLRLSPSNVRFSYESFGDFPNKLSINDVLPKIANINKQFYQSGFRHENMSSNNLCFLYPNSYVPTDFEELTSIYSVPASLDVQPTDHPMYLKIYPFKYSHNECYPNLLQSSYMDDQLTNSEINTNFQLSHKILMEHFASSVFFLFDDYFQMAIDDWLEFKLKQSFQDQLLLLTDYSDPNQSIEYDLLIKEYSEKFQPESDKRIGDFFSIHTMRTFFLVQKRIEPVFINQRIKQLKYLIRQIDSLLKSKQWFSIPSNYQSSFLQPELLNNYMDIYIFMFPFLQWVSHWITFLELNYNHDDRVKRLVQRLKNDIRHTSEIYTVFKQKSANQFIDYITMTNL